MSHHEVATSPAMYYLQWREGGASVAEATSQTAAAYGQHFHRQDDYAALLLEAEMRFMRQHATKVN